MAHVIGTETTIKKTEQGVKRALVAAGMIAVEAVKDQMLTGYGDPIWDTGATLQSVNYEAGDKSVAFGTGTSYAPFVHDGTYRMVARPFIADRIPRLLWNSGCALGFRVTASPNVSNTS